MYHNGGSSATTSDGHLLSPECRLSAVLGISYYLFHLVILKME